MMISIFDVSRHSQFHPKHSAYGSRSCALLEDGMQALTKRSTSKFRNFTVHFLNLLYDIVGSFSWVTW